VSRPSDRLVTPPDVAAGVQPREYARLLGYPPERSLEGPVLALGDASRDWYGRHGRPWVFGRTFALAVLTSDTVELEDGTRLDSRVLARRLRDAEAPALVAVTVSAGPEVDERVDRLWSEDRPDEAYFLDRFGVAVAEHLAAWCGETLRSPHDDELIALPGYSPGYSGWSLDQQVLLYELITGRPQRPLPGPLQVLDSGMLTPRSSLLAVFGLSAQRQLAAEAWARHRCTWCSLADCDFRYRTAVTRRDRDPDSG